MERSIRLGKDFNVLWSINKVVDGERQPYELAGKELVLQYRRPNGTLHEAKEWRVDGNIIIWTFRGRDQKAPGSYQLILTENGGKDGMVTVDTCRAFKLVAHSCEETEGSGSDIVIEYVVLESEVAFAPIVIEGGGGSYDDTEIKRDIADLQAKDAEQSAKLAELSAEVGGKEDKANKTTTLSSASTDTQYPSAKAAFMAISKKSEVSLEALVNGNLKVTIDGVSKDFMAATPSGDPLHYAYVAAGCVYNEETNLWSYGGPDIEGSIKYLDDLTTENVRNAYMVFPSFSHITPFKGMWGMPAVKTRFLFCMVSTAAISLDAVFQQNGDLEFIYSARDILPSSMVYALYGCKSLRYFHARMQMQYITAQSALTMAFAGCNKLETIKLFKIKHSYDFKDSSLLSNDSILYMIKNEGATSAITITLHADAYARAMADAEITAMLAAHPNVSLAKA